jgi:hypothetical protein
MLLKVVPLVRLFLAQGHARADRAEASRYHRRNDGNSGLAGAAERLGLYAGRTRAPVVRISPEIRRERDREMGSRD